MRSLLSLALPLALISVVACAPAPNEEPSGASANAVTAPAATTAKTYKASCGTRLNSADVTVTIEGNKVTKVTASIGTQDQKLQSDREATRWEGELTASGATEIISDVGTPSAVIHLEKGAVALSMSKLLGSDDGTKLVSSCKTSSDAMAIEFRSKVSPDGILRGISFSGIAPKDPACVSMDALTAATDFVGGDGTEGFWDISCDEDDTHASEEGLADLVAALTAAANP